MFQRIVCGFLLVSFSVLSAFPVPLVQAQPLLGLSEPGQMVQLSQSYHPMMIKGISVSEKNPFVFDFIVDPGQDKVSSDTIKLSSEKLVKYFLASLAITEDDLWVNLSPYEKGKILPNALGQTEMGRDLLAQDYILKQITASLIYPKKGLGQEFWDSVYEQARQKYGNVQIPVNTFNKVWIVADRAKVFEHNNSAFVLDSHLKVMLEEDYLAIQKHQGQPEDLALALSPSRLPSNRGLNAKASLGNNQSQSIRDLSKQMIKEIILPAIEKEVNEGKNFSNLRQIFNSIILSSWYKKRLKTALLNQVYANREIMAGIDLKDVHIKDKIYERYMQAYKKGVFDFIKEENVGGQMIPRKYFSGGVQIGAASAAQLAVSTDINEAMGNAAMQMPNAFKVTVAATPNDASMLDLVVSNPTYFLPLIGHVGGVLALGAGLARAAYFYKKAINAKDIDKRIAYLKKLVKIADMPTGVLPWAAVMFTGNGIYLASYLLGVSIDNLPYDVMAAGGGFEVAEGFGNFLAHAKALLKAAEFQKETGNSEPWDQEVALKKNFMRKFLLGLDWWMYAILIGAGLDTNSANALTVHGLDQSVQDFWGKFANPEWARGLTSATPVMFGMLAGAGVSLRAKWNAFRGPERIIREHKADLLKIAARDLREQMQTEPNSGFWLQEKDVFDNALHFVRSSVKEDLATNDILKRLLKKGFLREYLEGGMDDYYLVNNKVRPDTIIRFLRLIEDQGTVNPKEKSSQAMIVLSPQDRAKVLSLNVTLEDIGKIRQRSEVQVPKTVVLTKEQREAALWGGKGAVVTSSPADNGDDALLTQASEIITIANGLLRVTDESKQISPADMWNAYKAAFGFDADHSWTDTDLVIIRKYESGEYKLHDLFRMFNNAFKKRSPEGFQDSTLGKAWHKMIAAYDLPLKETLEAVEDYRESNRDEKAKEALKFAFEVELDSQGVAKADQVAAYFVKQLGVNVGNIINAAMNSDGEAVKPRAIFTRDQADEVISRLQDEGFSFNSNGEIYITRFLMNLLQRDHLLDLLVNENMLRDYADRLISRALVIKREVLANKAMLPGALKPADVEGGIDLKTSQMKWELQGKSGFDNQVDQAQLAQYLHDGIKSLSVNILRVVPIHNIWSVLNT